MKSIKVVAINLLLLLLIGIFAEIFLRSSIKFSADYYSSPSKKTSAGSSRNIHPYGSIPINSKGFYDKEWDNPKTKLRYAYFGDSVVYGVGAGYPNRITEYLDILETEVEHVNISGGLGASFLTLGIEAKAIANKIRANEIDKLVYVMNLNDIAPLSYQQNETKNNSDEILPTGARLLRNKFIESIDANFRGKSYLYGVFRSSVKHFLVSQLGLNSSGFKAIELQPNKYEVDIRKSAKNLSTAINDINSFGIDICILILPYEMQISNNARDEYKKMGIIFEDSFGNFKTQKIFINEFKNHSKINIYSLGNKFDEAEIGKYFVFNKGDKIDFNHPNHLGHKEIAREISENKLCM